MSLKFYMDENVPGAITKGLKQKGIGVITVQEDGRQNTEDNLILDRAKELGCIMFSRDDDFLKEANKRLQQGLPFAGVIYAHQQKASIGQCIEDLEIIAQTCTYEELENTVHYLPI